MSGTSLDGIDAALVDLIPRGEGYAVKVERFVTEPFEPRLRERLEAALPPERGSTAAVAQLPRGSGRGIYGGCDGDGRRTTR